MQHSRAMEQPARVWDMNDIRENTPLLSRANALEQVAAAARRYRFLAPLRDPSDEQSLRNYVHAMEELDAALHNLDENPGP